MIITFDCGEVFIGKERSLDVAPTMSEQFYLLVAGLGRYYLDLGYPPDKVDRQLRHSFEFGLRLKEIVVPPEDYSFEELDLKRYSIGERTSVVKKEKTNDEKNTEAK